MLMDLCCCLVVSCFNCVYIMFIICRAESQIAPLGTLKFSKVLSFLKAALLLWIKLQLSINRIKKLLLTWAVNIPQQYFCRSLMPKELQLKVSELFYFLFVSPLLWIDCVGFTWVWRSNSHSCLLPHLCSWLCHCDWLLSLSPPFLLSSHVSTLCSFLHFGPLPPFCLPTFFFF